MSIPATEAVTPGMFSGPYGAGSTGTSTSAGAATTTTAPKQADKEMFLQLLVAQLRYQDPSNPTDSSQFLAQSAQFTALEKMEAIADQTQQMVSAQMAFGASGLVGRTVTWADAAGTTRTDVVSGVNFGAQGPMLRVGDSDVALAQVQTVTAADAAADPSTGTDQQ